MDRSKSDGTPVLTGVLSFSGRVKWTASAFTEGCIRQHPAVQAGDRATSNQASARRTDHLTKQHEHRNYEQ